MGVPIGNFVDSRRRTAIISGIDRVVTLIPHSLEEAGRSRLNLDGIIAFDPSADDPMVTGLLETGLPLVSGKEMLAPLTAPLGQVVSNHSASTKEILDSFAAAGATHPALITPQERMTWGLEIEEAYRKWCDEHDVVPRGEVASLEELAESTRQTTHALLAVASSEAPVVDAILALTDGSMLNVVTSAAEFGRTVGKDPLIAAAVDSPVLGYTDPAVTVVDLRPREFGRTCMSVMGRVLEVGDTKTGVVSEAVCTRVIHRASTAGDQRWRGERLGRGSATPPSHQGHAGSVVVVDPRDRPRPAPICVLAAVQNPDTSRTSADASEEPRLTGPGPTSSMSSASTLKPSASDESNRCTAHHRR